MPVKAFLTAAILAAAATPASAQTPAKAPVTFTRDIAPILQRSCQQCHRPDSVAPMSLLTYEEVRPYARAIKQRTALRSKPGVMPPWYIEKNVGIQKYKDDISLSDEEIEKIAAWADNGAPRGNPADMPPPLVFADDSVWKIGKPDLIVASPDLAMKALAPDWFGAIGESPTNLPEDRYVAAIEIKEVNDARGRTPTRKTVGGLYTFHHAAFGVLGADGRGNIGGWPVHEVGRNADVFDPDAGKLIPANARLTFFSVHAHSNGLDTKAHLEVGFKFHPKGYKPKVNFQQLFVGNGPDIDIRGGEANQRMDAYYTLAQHTKITTFEPHMHAPGVRMCLEAIWGINVQTLSCAGYNHSWVRVYNYADDSAPLLPKGTILHVIGYFDNSPANKNVADPRNWSGSGHRSVDNMVINLMEVIAMNDEQFRSEMAKRRAALGLKDGQSVLGCPLCGSSASAQGSGVTSPKPLRGEGGPPPARTTGNPQQ
jgi:mono/diheme cytochrome c family protein